MPKKVKRPSHISQEDWDDADIPELTAEDFKLMRPLQEADPALYEALKRARGRPPVERPKRQITLRLPPDIIDRIKASGKGYNARIEKVLRQALNKGLL